MDREEPSGYSPWGCKKVGAWLSTTKHIQYWPLKSSLVSTAWQIGLYLNTPVTGNCSISHINCINRNKKNSANTCKCLLNRTWLEVKLITWTIWNITFSGKEKRPRALWWSFRLPASLSLRYIYRMYFPTLFKLGHGHSFVLELKCGWKADVTTYKKLEGY